MLKNLILLTALLAPLALTGCADDLVAENDAPNATAEAPTDATPSAKASMLCQVTGPISLSNPTSGNGVKLSWNEDVEAHENCEIYIERSENGGTWTTVNNDPLEDGETSYVDPNYSLGNKFSPTTVQWRARTGSTSTLWSYSPVAHVNVLARPGR